MPSLGSLSGSNFGLVSLQQKYIIQKSLYIGLRQHTVHIIHI